MKIRLAVVVSSLSLTGAFGQAVITQVGAGLGSSSLKVAPGQVLTVHVRGLTTKFDATQVATSLPLPRDFGGVSVTLRQNNHTTGVPLPLVRGDFSDACAWRVVAPDVRSQPPCNDADAGSFVFQVQMPFDLVVNGTGPLEEVRTIVADAVLAVQDNGRIGRDIRMVPVVDQVQVLRRCSGPDQLFGEDRCAAEIYHSDGRAVTASKPARSGEQLIAYAYGLGRTETVIEAGTATPNRGLKLATPVSVRFSGLAGNQDTAVYSGVVPGQVGLYQVNFQVPDLPSAMSPCDTHSGQNLTMVVAGQASSDTVGFCAQP
jgi:uncharacterized protein (TIGR03437 family)